MQTQELQAQLQALPLWAAVALAARTLRRIQPLLGEALRDPAELRRWWPIVDEAVRRAERAASLGHRFRAGRKPWPGQDQQPASEGAIELVKAAGAAYFAAYKSEQRQECIRWAEAALSRSIDACQRVRGEWGAAVIRTAIERDLAHLQRRTKAEDWDDQSPVPPWAFGPVWPEGDPLKQARQTGDVEATDEAPPSLETSETPAMVISIEVTVRLARLPRWASGALATRCAQRVRPIVERFWPDIPGETAIALDQEIAGAEKMAESANTAGSLRTGPANDSLIPDDNQSGLGWAVVAAQEVHEGAAEAVALIDGLAGMATSIGQGDPGMLAALAGYTAEAAVGVAGHVDPHLRRIMAQHILDDLAHLERWARREQPTAKQGVPTSVMGPLWPGGEPKELSG